MLSFFVDVIFESGAPDLSFQRAMYSEHCVNPGFDFEFETSNYHIKTTARREWNIVVQNEPLAPSESGHGRRLPALDELELLHPRSAVGRCKDCTEYKDSRWTDPVPGTIHAVSSSIFCNR